MELVMNPLIEGVIIPHLPDEVSPEYYILRINEYDKIPETPLDEWMTYLKTCKVKKNTRTPGLQEVKKKLQIQSMTPKEQREYDAHMDTIMVQNDVLDTARDEGRARGLEEVRAEVRAEGRAEERASIARNLLVSGMDTDTICTVTQLSKQEVEAIRRDMDTSSN